MSLLCLGTAVFCYEAESERQQSEWQLIDDVVSSPEVADQAFDLPIVN